VALEVRASNSSLRRNRRAVKALGIVSAADSFRAPRFTSGRSRLPRLSFSVEMLSLIDAGLNSSSDPGAPEKASQPEARRRCSSSFCSAACAKGCRSPRLCAFPAFSPPYIATVKSSEQTGNSMRAVPLYRLSGRNRPRPQESRLRADTIRDTHGVGGLVLRSRFLRGAAFSRESTTTSRRNCPCSPGAVAVGAPSRSTAG